LVTPGITLLTLHGDGGKFIHVNSSATEGAEMFTNVVFMQGDEGREVADRLFNVEGVVAHGIDSESAAEAVEYLRQWDYGDNDDTSEELGNGTDDVVVFHDGYILTANLGLGYVGLSRKAK
jgi:hypothetical protein